MMGIKSLGNAQYSYIHLILSHISTSVTRTPNHCEIFLRYALIRYTIFEYPNCSLRNAGMDWNFYAILQGLVWDKYSSYYAWAMKLKFV